MEKITDAWGGEQGLLLAKKTVITMLDEGTLVIIDGKVALARGSAAPPQP